MSTSTSTSSWSLAGAARLAVALLIGTAQAGDAAPILGHVSFLEGDGDRIIGEAAFGYDPDIAARYKQDPTSVMNLPNG